MHNSSAASVSPRPSSGEGHVRHAPLRPCARNSSLPSSVSSSFPFCSSIFSAFFSLSLLLFHLQCLLSPFSSVSSSFLFFSNAFGVFFLLFLSSLLPTFSSSVSSSSFLFFFVVFRIFFFLSLQSLLSSVSSLSFLFFSHAVFFVLFLRSLLLCCLRSLLPPFSSLVPPNEKRPATSVLQDNAGSSDRTGEDRVRRLPKPCLQPLNCLITSV